MCCTGSADIATMSHRKAGACRGLLQPSLASEIEVLGIVELARDPDRRELPKEIAHLLRPEPSGMVRTAIKDGIPLKTNVKENNLLSTVFRMARVAVTPRWSILTSKLDNGATVSGYNRDGYGGRGVYIYRESLEPELEALPQFVKSGDVFVDIGANVGVYAMKAAKEVGSSGLVVAVEPFIGSAYQLSRNIAANGFDNVRLRNCCIGRETGDTRLYLNQGKPNSFGLRCEDTSDSVSIFSTTVDELCKWERLDRVDYIKIDAEGAEADILCGASETIRRYHPIIQVEITKGDVAPLADYWRVSAPGSPNSVYIPYSDTQAVSRAVALGWKPDATAS
jgi:FkbM family methyltransferase